MKVHWVKGISSIFLLWYFFLYIQDPMGEMVVNHFHLVMHEAGHTLAMFFGTFIHVLAGTAFQIFVPAVFVGYFFWYRREMFSGSVLLYLLGSSIINAGIYISDGAARALPLLGGDPDGHDWYYLLGVFDLLPHAPNLGLIVRMLGIMVIFAAAVLTFFYSLTKKDV